MIYRKQLDTIKKRLFKQKVILLLGARQVGKTTLLKRLVKDLDVKTEWLNADEGDILNELIAATTSTQLRAMVGKGTRLVIIDEAQQVPDIGLKLKLLIDTGPNIQVIATGSSSFDSLNRTNEPLTGRKRLFYLYPLSFAEMAAYSSRREEKRMLERRLIYGYYPEVVNNPGSEKEVLLEIAQSYLYKDVLRFDGIRKSAILEKLLRALAFQVGSEVSFNELARTIGNIEGATVEKYLDLLEKTYVIYKLPALNRNMRNEIKKGKKYYFFDNGIRNVLINNFSSLDYRFDKGALWENFLLSERIKHNHYTGLTPNTYFWRTHDQAEIDYIEESDGILNAFELKWDKTKIRFPNSFLKSYPNHQTHLVNKDNFQDFVSF